MNDLDLEYLIAQYADGSLGPERVAEVEAVLRRDVGARSLLEVFAKSCEAFPRRPPTGSRA